MQSLWKKAVFCALILTSCLPVSAMNTTGKQPQEDPQNPVSFAAAVKKDGKWGVINDRAEVVIPMQYDKAAITLAPRQSADQGIIHRFSFPLESY